MVKNTRLNVEKNLKKTLAGKLAGSNIPNLAADHEKESGPLHTRDHGKGKEEDFIRANEIAQMDEAAFTRFTDRLATLKKMRESSVG